MRSRLDKKAIVLIVLVMVIAVVYCLLLFGGYSGTSDTCDYGGLALNLISGKGFTVNHVLPLSLVFIPNVPQPNCTWAPGYPVFLAGVFTVLGVSDYSILGANLFLFLMVIISGYFLTKKYVNYEAALIFVLFMGLNQYSYYTILYGSPEMLAAALLTFSLLLWGDNYRRVIIAGLFYGLAVLTRYQMVILLPVYLVFFKKINKKYIVFIAVVVIVCAGWLVRNIVLFGDPLFCLQRYGEFTKGMGIGDDFYYTYRSLEPAGFFYVISTYPLLFLRKLAVGVTYFLRTLPEHLNSFGLFLVFWAIIYREKLATLNSNKSRMGVNLWRPAVRFLIIGVALTVIICLFDGQHHRHLYIFNPLMIMISSAGFNDFALRTGIMKKRFYYLVLLLFFLIPLQFPQQEVWLRDLKVRIKAEIPVYREVAINLSCYGPVASDASDALWWYSGLNTVWMPTNYETFVKVDSLIDIKAVYFQKDDWLKKLDKEERRKFMISFPEIRRFNDGSVLYIKSLVDGRLE